MEVDCGENIVKFRDLKTKERKEDNSLAIHSHILQPHWPLVGASAC